MADVDALITAADDIFNEFLTVNNVPSSIKWYFKAQLHKRIKENPEKAKETFRVLFESMKRNEIAFR